ncbi:MAG: tetratricopeptide repeat protein [Magnetococcales bacterium]|nr:tetratricopeptide repeat protein [Magnetococcales bacterium]
MNTQLQSAQTAHTPPHKGFLHGLTSFLTRRKEPENQENDWNHWMFLRIHNFEVHIAGPGVPVDPQALETWEPLLEDVTTLEFRPCPKDDAPATPDHEMIRLEQGMTRLMDKLAPILASDQIRWVPGLDQPEPSDLNELLAKRFVAEKIIRDPDLTERLYLQALTLEPENADILGAYALFQHEVRRDPNEAETLYRRAVRANPDHAVNLDNYAVFLQEVRKEYDEAERLYRRAHMLEPHFATHLGNLALFLHEVRGDDDQAEELFRNALKTDGQDAAILGNFALFLHNTRRDDDQAEQLYRRALEANGQDANTLGNFALFQKNVRRDYDTAEHLFREALRIDPNHSAHLGNFALFMKNIRHDYDQAEAYYHRALEADPNDSNHLGNLAFFMKNLRRDHAAAEDLYRRSLQVEPNNAIRLGNFVQLLLCQGRPAEGLPLLTRAITLVDETNPVLSLELWFYVLAHDLKQFAPALGHIRRLLHNGIRSPGWDLQCNCQRAMQDHHPHPELVTALAAVINSEAPLESLERFPEWQRE